jgi:chromosome partitioning protein
MDVKNKALSQPDGNLTTQKSPQSRRRFHVKQSDNPLSLGGFQGSPLATELSENTRRLAAINAATIDRPAETRIFTVANQKGGVGKTTTAVNLAVALAEKGMNVLVIDLDPQGNASTALGIDHHAVQGSIYDVLVGNVLLADVMQQSPESVNLKCVPATLMLAGAEMALYPLSDREYRLKNAIQHYIQGTSEKPDYIFIDCPPSLGQLTVNALTAATEVLIPIQCEYYALEGLSQLKVSIDMIKGQSNPGLALSTILLTMFNSRTRLNIAVVEDVRAHFPNQTLKTIIPRQIGVAEAPGYGKTVINYDRNSNGSISYMEAAIEIANKGVQHG